MKDHGNCRCTADRLGRALGLRMRSDLVVARRENQKSICWVIKDPVGLNYHRLHEEEYALLKMLDGRSSLEEIKVRFEAEFAPQKIDLQELGQFLAMLHKAGLIVSQAPGQGKQLRLRHDRRKRQQRLAWFSNILAVRFRGLYPDRWLAWLEPKTRWFFSTWVVAFCCLLAATALSLVAVRFDVFRARLPGFYEFFTVGNAFWLMVVLAVTKILHEFGHGLLCKRFGGECPEMGLMLLVFTPCLYCNVSDSWLLTSKWQRMAVAAAGMYVELVIASVSTFVWWFSEPGLLNHLCLNTMFVCSVSTLLFNGNPLLRYDGYYILADLLEIPNLRQKADTVLRRSFGQWFLGIEPQDDAFLPRRNRWLLAAYALAAPVYRWLVVLSILLFLHALFKPYHLEVICQAIALATLFGLLVVPLWKLGKFFHVPGRIELVKKSRLAASMLLLVVVAAGLVWVPLPHRVYGTLELEPRQARRVYVQVPGVVQTVLVQPGERVEAGTTLAQLANVDTLLAVAQLTAHRDQLRTQLATLRQRRFEDHAAGLAVPEIQKALAAVDEQLRQKQDDIEQLRLTAPVTGTVLPPPELPAPPNEADTLAVWSGSPLSTDNRGCYLQQSTLFCEVGDPRQLEAVVVIDQADIELVRVGQRVEIKLDELPGATLAGRIEEISAADVKESPRHLSNKAGGDLATRTDASGVERPLFTSYQARIPLDNGEQLLRLGFRGRAKIHVGRRPPAARLWRWFSQTFHFRI